MKNFLGKISYNMQQFMTGRYGTDELSRFLTVFGVFCILIAAWDPFTFAYFLGAALIIWSLYRSLSKNHRRRCSELGVYQRITAKPKKLFTLLKNMWRDRKTHRYFKCKNCGAVLRVPKNRGKIEITCPACHTKAIKNT